MIRSFVANISPAISHRGWISISQYSKPFNKGKIDLIRALDILLKRNYCAT